MQQQAMIGGHEAVRDKHQLICSNHRVKKKKSMGESVASVKDHEGCLASSLEGPDESIPLLAGCELCKL